jgi:ABC-type multidrug transport system ATPase subunit
MEATNLTKTYISKGPKGEELQETKVLDVSFNVFENEIMGILGPSGAGKSSIFKMMAMAIARSGG